MTKNQIDLEVRVTACKLIREHGVPPPVAYRMASSAARRVSGSFRSGLGAEVIPTKPIAILTGETVDDRAPASILANVAAAGDDPTVAAARSAVSKWSWLIPVGGLIMSAKNKISALRSPTSAAIVGMGRRR